MLVEMLPHVEVCHLPVALTSSQARSWMHLAWRIATSRGIGGDEFLILAVLPKQGCDGQGYLPSSSQMQAWEGVWDIPLTFMQLRRRLRPTTLAGPVPTLGPRPSRPHRT